jgi:PKD repeat protein
MAALIQGLSPSGVPAPVVETSPAHAQYQALFQKKLAEIPRWKDVLSLPKRMRPDMFAVHDKLQRMDPATGEVPADGYINAYRYIQEEWGIDNPTEQSGYALQWIERGPTQIGGRTRAFLWDPNDAQGKAAFAGGVGGGLWHTDDVTVTSPNWTNVSPIFSNVAVTCIAHDPSNPSVMYYGTGEGWFNADAIRGAGVWKSTDAGSTWDVLPSSTNGLFYYCQDILVDTDGTTYIATKSGLMRSTDGGLTFTKCLGIGTGLGLDWITDLETAGNGDIYATISGSGVYRSLGTLGTNQGTVGSWVRLSGLSLPAGYGRIELAVGKNNSNYLYAVTEVGNAASDIYRSTNGGTTWGITPGQPENGNDFSNGQAWYDLCLEVDPTDHLTVYTGAIDQYRSANGGNTWTQLTAAYGGSQPYIHPDQHNIIVNPLDPNKVVYTNDGGVFYSSQKGSNTAVRNNNYNVTQYYSIAIDPRPYSNVLIGGTQDNGCSMVDQVGIGAGIDLTGSDGGYVAINQAHPDTMWTTTQWATVYRSRNGGATFNYVGNPALNDQNTLFINPLEIDGANNNVLYQASTALWRHGNANAGGSGGWVQVTRDLNTNITAIGPAKNVANVVYFAAGGTIYRLANANTSNSTTNPPTVNPAGAAAGYINCILVNPADANHIIVTYSSFGLTRRVMECRNADQGSNAIWKNLTGNLPDIPCNWAAFEPDNANGILVGTDMGIYRCADITPASSSIYWSPENLGMGLPRVSMLKTKYLDKSIHAGTHGRGFFSTFSYNQLPSALFGVNNTVACGGLVQFTDSTANVPSSWAWDFGDGGTSTLQSPVHQYAASGTYTVSLTATNSNGTDSYSLPVTVTVLPSAVAVAGPDLDGCPGDSLQLSASGGVSYSWFPTAGLNNPLIANPIALVSGTRTYVVTVTDANGCSDTDTLVVTQLAAPNIWAGADQTITAPGGSVQLQGSGGVTYQWSPATGLSCTTCPNPVASPTATTVYTCTGTNANGCSKSDNVTVFVSIVGINDPDAIKAGFLSVAPNPATDQTRIQFQTVETGPLSLDLLDVNGRTVARLLTGDRVAGVHALTWQRGQEFASGVYFLRLQSGGKSYHQRLVLAH